MVWVDAHVKYMTTLEKIKYASKVAYEVYLPAENRFYTVGCPPEDFVQRVLERCTEVGWDNIASGKGMGSYILRIAYTVRDRVLRHTEEIDYVEPDSDVLDCYADTTESIHDFLNTLWDYLPKKPVYHGRTYREIIERYLDTADWESSVGTTNWNTICVIRQRIKGFIKYAGQDI